jgi:CotS family spore coat protein
MPYPDKLYDNNILSEDNVKKYVIPYYGLDGGDISQIKFKDTDKQRAVYKVDYLDKSYCLKKVYFPEDELLFVYSAIEWFYIYGINVPRLLPTKSRGRYVSYNNMFFILTPWIEGEKCNYDSIQHVLEAGTCLAAMHNAGTSFVPIQGSAIRKGYEDTYSSQEKHFGQLLMCSNSAFKYGDKFSKLFLQHFEQNITLAKTSLEISRSINLENLTKTLCHLDYVNKNLIFDNYGKLWVIDFDKCRMDFSVHDISYFLRRLLKRDNTKWDLEIAINCLKFYEEVRPLTLDEYKYILVYLSFPQKFWKVSRDYYNNINKCNPNSFYTLLYKTVEKDANQIQFVNDFQSYIEEKFHIDLDD